MVEKRKRDVVNLAGLRRRVEETPCSATAHYELGTALLKLGLAEEAEQELKRCLELEPRRVAAWVNLGGVHLSRWDFQGCVAANEEALKVDPTSVPAYFNKGLGYLYLGNAQRMVRCFEKVVELDGRNAEAFYHLAVGWRDLGDLQRARDCLNRAMQLGCSPEPEFLKELEKNPDPGGEGRSSSNRKTEK